MISIAYLGFHQVKVLATKQEKWEPESSPRHSDLFDESDLMFC